jgi:hypothetical protein
MIINFQHQNIYNSRPHVTLILIFDHFFETISTGTSALLLFAHLCLSYSELPALYLNSDRQYRLHKVK